MRLKPLPRARPKVFADQYELVSADAIEQATVARAFTVCAVIYLAIIAVEAPVRYFLYQHGHDNLIVLRDGLIIGPLAVLFAFHAMRLKLHPAYPIFGMLTAFHALVLIGNTGSLIGAASGVKIVVNILFGFFARSALLSPRKGIARFLFLIWVVMVVAVCLDKFLLTFPWVGMKTVVGGLDVNVSKDWEVTDELARRAAGFARSSISGATLLPPITFVLMCMTRRWPHRAALALLGVGTVILTTQKGSIIASALVALILLLPLERAARPLRLSFLAVTAMAICLPVVAAGLHMAHGAGVFSTESLMLRVSYTWPEAWDWILRHQMLVFGVGLGGIGGPQRFYALASFNPADNIFVLLYAYFGIFAFVYIGAVGYLVWRRVTGSSERVLPALAILTFLVGYGAVLSIIEDQSASLFIGTAIGVLWQETQKPRLSRLAILRATLLGPRHAARAG